ncbi:hypothetical protein [Cryptosporangium sp. NPDC051539]|uniref:hypothetical protein n=1 Tax=Cryptosporangium sp. NPDC051539 TaxID=3363962 RepID=UPI0037B10DDC
MKAQVQALWSDCTGSPRLPAHLEAVLRDLERSAWPEVVTRWSRLTPSGFPVEVTVGPPGTAARWVSEVARPEVPDPERVDRAAGHLQDAHQPLNPVLLDALRAAQRGRDLQYGAWLGGREHPDGTATLKLYAELPAGVAYGLPEPLKAAHALLPAGSEPRMLGLEPATGRTELYVRLPALDPPEVTAMLHALGRPDAAHTLEANLVDGLHRLAGRKLGLSLAAGPPLPIGPPLPTGSDRAPLDLALFVTARTLFPFDPAMLDVLAPQVSTLRRRWRPGPVTLAPITSSHRLPAAVGMAPA